MGKYTPQKLPLYAGTSEDKDTQGRRNGGAFKAEGVRFFDKGTVTTHREPRQRLEIDSGEYVVAEASSTLMVRDSTGLKRWREGTELGEALTEYTHDLMQEGISFQDGGNAHAAKLFSVDGDLVSISLSGNSLDNAVTLRVIDPESQAAGPYVEVNAPGPSTTFRAAAQGTRVLAGFNYNEPFTSTYNLHLVSFEKVGGNWVAGNSHTQSFPEVVRNFSFQMSDDDTIVGVVTVSNILSGQETRAFSYNASTDTFAESVLGGAGSNYTGYRCFATHWTGTSLLVYSSGIDTEGYTWEVAALTATVPAQLATDDYYGRIKGNVSTDDSQGAQDAQIVPRGAEFWLIVSGGLEVSGANAADDWSYHSSMGTSVFHTVGGWGATSLFVDHIGTALLTAEAWVEDNELLMPLAWTGAYHVLGAAINRSPFAWDQATLHVPISTLRSTPPVFGGGLLVAVDTEPPRVVSVWGTDEVFGSFQSDHNGDDPTFRTRGGSTQHEGTTFLVHPVSRSAASSVLQVYQKVPGVAEAVSTPAGVAVLQGGTLALVDSDELQHIALVSPPVVMLYGNTNYPGVGDPAPDIANLRFCWAWTDSEGTTHRSSPSQAVSAPMESEGIRIQITPPPPVSALSNGKLYMEVYSDTGSTGTATGVFHFLTRTFIYPGLPQQLTISSVTFAVNSSLLYTSGGVLGNEAPSVGEGLFLVQDRLWYLRGDKAYYSQVTTKGQPLEFNGNLYVSAPDGKDIVGIAELDEQAVLFTEQGIFVTRGQGPNRTGGGNGFLVHSLPSSTGCLDRRSILTTEHGVFFLGHRGLHLIQRNNTVTFIGHATSDTLETPIAFSLLDRENKEAQWWLESGDVVSFHLESGLWAVASGTIPAVSGVFTPQLSRAVVSTEGLFVDSETTVATSGDLFPVGNTYPLDFSTSWLDAADIPGGFQRIRKVLIQGRGDVEGRFVPATYDGQGVELTPEQFVGPDPITHIRVRVFTDFDEVASTDKRIPIHSIELDPIDLRIDLDTRKCKTFRVQVSIEGFIGSLMLSGLTASVQLASTESKLQQGT